MNGTRATVVCLWVAVHAWLMPARADVVDPDTEVARRHYDDGAQAYDQLDYERALTEFRAAEVLAPSPALSYNIGRTYDRMGKWQAAVDEYQRFVDAKPDDPQASSVRARIVLLRQRLDRATPPVAAVAVAPVPAEPARRPLYKRAWLWGAVAGGVVLGLSVGLGVGLGVRRDPSASYGTVRGN